MRASSDAMVGIVGFVVVEHGPEQVGALASERDDGLDVAFTFAPLAVAVGAAFKVDGVERSQLLVNGKEAFAHEQGLCGHFA